MAVYQKTLFVYLKNIIIVPTLLSTLKYYQTKQIGEKENDGT